MAETADPETRRLQEQAIEAIRLADLPRLRELLLEAEARLAAAPPSRKRAS